MSHLEDERKVSADYIEDTGSVDLNAVALAAQYVPGSDEEKALVWKIDKHIIVSLFRPYLSPPLPSHLQSRPTLVSTCTLLDIGVQPIRFIPPRDRYHVILVSFADIQPTIWLLYMLGYLDRANIGNAKTGGLESDFGLTSTQYSVVLLVFFISYVLFEIPSNLLLAVSHVTYLFSPDLLRS